MVKFNKINRKLKPWKINEQSNLFVIIEIPIVANLIDIRILAILVVKYLRGKFDQEKGHRSEENLDLMLIQVDSFLNKLSP